jgi:hypothetical protein
MTRHPRPLAACVVVCAGLATATLLFACSSEDPPADTCVPVAIDAACTPAYEPSFDQVFARTFKPTCAKSGGICHASTGRQGGISFDDADEAFRNLHATGVVRDGDPACSKLVGRITSTDGKRRMPPGASLPAGEQCAIERWIANGGKR